MKKLFFSSLVATSVLFGSTSVDININNDTLELNGDVLLNDMFNLSNNANYYCGVSYLTTKSNGNKSNQNLSTVSFKALNPYVDNYGFNIGMGIKTVYSNQLDMNFNAVALGLFFKYELNEAIYFNLDANYAPRVLSFMNAEKYSDIKLKMNYKVLDGGYIYVGGRNITTRYENKKDIKFDDSIFFGYQVKF